LARELLTAALGAALVMGGACRDVQPYEGMFDVPVAAAVLQPEVSRVFEEPIGFVANGHGGRIVQLALKQGRFLTDDPKVAFLRTNTLATGTGRLLSSVAVTGVGDAVTVWAADKAWGTLLRVPYVLDCGVAEPPPECASASFGAPVEQRATWEILESPSSELTGIEIKQGYTTTETWTIVYDGSGWNVEGSRSARQEPAFLGVSYVATDRSLAFTIRSGPTPPVVGDTFVLKTDTGLSEHDVGGVPLALLTMPGQELLAMVVQDAATDRPVVRWFDTVSRSTAGDVALADGAVPHRLALSEDGLLLVADAALPAVWEAEAGAASATEHPMPWPVLDVASLDGALRRGLFVVPIDGGSLWLVDRDTNELVDVNASLEGDQGITFTATITGIEAMHQRYRMPEVSDDEVRLIGRSVALSLSNGTVVFAHEDTGCLVQDALGPRTSSEQANTFVDYTITTPGATLGTPVLETNGASDRHVIVNPCGGVARSEGWTAVFDQNVQAWRVSGTIAGEQEALAYEEERYLSDEGEVSFTIRAGASPSKDGWSIRFVTEAGVAVADADVDNDGSTDVSLGVGSDPVAFYYRVGLPGPIDAHDGDGWLPVDIRPFVLVTGGSSDEVARVDAELGILDAGWQ
jgi:hypothetical protein